MTLFKRGNVWWAYVWIDGVRHHKSTGTSNRRQAQAIGQAFESDLNLKRHQLPELQPEMTVNELFTRFVGEGLARPHSLDRLQHVLPFFGSMRLAKIDKASVRRYRQQRHAASEITVATANRDVAVLRRLLYFAVEEGFIGANPLARMRMERERRTKRPVLSVREEQLLVAAAPLHVRQIVLCALDTGMRRGEILAQRWEDIDPDNKLLYVSHSKTPEGEMREIPLTGRLYAMLVGLRKAWEEEQEKTKEEPNMVIFTFANEPLKNIKTAWKASLRRSKIRHFRFHDLRHTANTRLMLAGVMQEVRRELIGHSSRHSRDVNDRYSQVSIVEKRDAIRKLDLWLDAEAAKLAQPEFAPAETQEP
jgi:integrase